MFIKVAIASLVFLVMTVFKTYPLIVHFNTHIPSDPGDPLFVAWILAWDFHALTSDPGSLFNANIFYPVENALAFSENMLGVLPIFAPAYAMTRNPIFAYNVVFLLSFILSGVAMFLLIHYWTESFWASHSCQAYCLPLHRSTFDSFRIYRGPILRFVENEKGRILSAVPQPPSTG